MKPAKKTHLFFIENEGVLFSEPMQKLFHLNTVAAFVWCMLEEGKGQSSILTDLQTTFSLSQSDATLYLEQANELFQSLGVLRGFEPIINREQESETAPVKNITYDGECFFAEHHYRLLNSNIRMRFSHPSQLDAIAPILSHLEVDGPFKPTVTLDIVQDSSADIFLCRNQTPVLSCKRVVQLAPLAKSLVWQTAINDHHFFLDIHAGVVSDGTCCYLFPASPGSGKSTLTATLVYHGFEYFSDEVALLHEDNLLVQPVPLATCVKDTGIEVLARYYPKLKKLDQHHRSDGKHVRYLAPEKESLPPPDTLRPVGAIIFPCHKPDQQTALTPLAPIEALQLLMQECLIVDTHLDRNKVSGLLDWILKTPCYRLTVSDLQTAVDIIKTLSNESSQKANQSSN
ncbi:hypothetical protein [Sedimenticola sp.]|uniref:hypothetical protein n=1 Tax=Sedimenticola sp. TaxID=1940285 RepID=UPI003D0B42BC